MTGSADSPDPAAVPAGRSGPLVGTRLPVPWTSLRDRLAEVAAAHPAATAVRDGGGRLSYGALDRLARDAGAVLAGQDPDRPVAVDATDGDAQTVAALVAVVYSGRPLVVLDPLLPEARRAAIVAQTGAVRTTAAQVWDRAHTRRGARPALPPIPARRCAVLLCTSGSTGAPKLVVQGQRQWLNQTVDLRHTLGIRSADRMGTALPIGFGGGLDVVFTALTSGALLDVRDPRIHGIDGAAGWAAAHRLTTLHLSPALLRALLDTAPADRLAGLRLISTCGEAVYGADVEAAHRVLGAGAEYVNLSGSSEVGSLAFARFPVGLPVPEATVPAGAAAVNKTIRILGPDARPVAPGRVGEIEVSSDHLAEGYACDPDGHCTGPAARFLPDTGDGRAYRTGDLGRIDAQGRLHLVGRSDDAVKVRGYLVDTGEVTAALRQIPGVRDAVVLARPGADRTTELVGYYAVGAAESPRDTSEVVTARLRSALPAWMVPAALIALPALPRNERGKIDRAALPDPGPERGRAGTAPVGPTETALADIWRELLGLVPVREDDFAALGGDSLQFQRLIAAITATFSITVTPAVLTAAPTLAALAAHIDSAPAAPTAGRIGLEPALPLAGHTAPGRPVVFAFAGAGAPAISLAPLARELADTADVYGLQARGLERRALPQWSVRAAARRHVRQILAARPRGPYVLIGHSLGGVLALEAARILTRHGRAVEAVVCLDTVLTGPLTAHPLRPRRAPDVPVPQGTDDDASLWRTRAALLTAGLVRRPPRRQWALFHELGRRSALLHRLRPWPGPVTVVLAEDNPDSADLWHRHVPTTVAVHRLGGDHVGILRPPHVADTAAVVRALCAAPVRAAR